MIVEQKKYRTSSVHLAPLFILSVVESTNHVSPLGSKSLQSLLFIADARYFVFTCSGDFMTSQDF
jgi:hypothetical protein